MPPPAGKYNMKDVFIQFDADGDGRLDMHEVRVPYHAAIVRPPSAPTAASAYHITWWHAVL